MFGISGLAAFATLSLILANVNAQVIDLEVDLCTTLETRFTVNNGYVGGTVYIEGTTQNFSDCHRALAGDATDVFQLTFDTCGVTYGFLASSNTIDFYVVITQYPFANIFSDPRFHVRCSFQESTNNVDIQVESVTADKSGTEKKHDTDPSAIISLCKETSEGTCDVISYSNTVTMGDNLTLRFDLSPQVPNYKLRVDECFFEAKDQQTGISASTLQLLDSLTHCSDFSIFPDFVHAAMAVTSSGGNSFEIPYATTSFTAFIPLTVTKELALVDLDLVIGCKVALCFDGSNDCTAPSCSAERRKRQIDTDDLESNTTKTWLYEGFKMQIVNHGNTHTDPSDPTIGASPTQPGTNDICLDELEFWTMLLSLLVMLLCVTAGFGCFVLSTRRHRRRRKIVDADRISSASVTKSTSISSLSTTSGSRPYLLPRLVPISTSSFGKH